MSDKIFQNTNLEHSLIKFFKKNIKVIIVFLTALLLLFVTLIYIDNKNKKKNILISNLYNDANILIKNNKNLKATDILLNIIEEKNRFYSPLSLYLILENDLEKKPEKILILFDKVIKIKKIEKENKNLIIIKKALYLTKYGNEQEILSLLNPIINSNSIWRKEAILLLTEYFNSKSETKKAEEYYQLLSVIN